MLKSENSVEFLLAAVISNLHSDQFLEHLSSWLGRCVAHDNVTILAYFSDQPPMLLMKDSHHPKVHKNIHTGYLTGAYLLDPFNDLHVNRVPSGVYRLSVIAPDKFYRSRYFLDYYSDTTIIDEIGFVTYPSPDVSLHICLGRDGNSNTKFTTGNISTARRIAPLVTALSQAHWQSLASTGQHIEKNTTLNLIEAVKQNHRISLSPRQAEVAIFILQGHSSVSIGLKLGISYQTVKVFRKQLYKKCIISSQAELFSMMLPMLGYQNKLTPSV